MPQTPHVEKHFTGGETVRDIVIGMSDGLTVPFALAAGLSGAVVASGLVVTAGRADRRGMRPRCIIVEDGIVTEADKCNPVHYPLSIPKRLRPAARLERRFSRTAGEKSAGLATMRAVHEGIIFYKLDIFRRRKVDCVGNLDLQFS